MIKMLKDYEFLKKFIHVALPVMLHALLLFIVNLIDNIMVGSVSNEAISGVFAANQATYILMIAAYGVIIGAGIYIQQYHGANDEQHLQQAFRYKIVIMLGFIVLVTLIYYLFGHHLVWMYCHNDTNSEAIYAEGMKYFNLIVLSYIPYCLSMIYTTTVREIGKTKYALIAGIVAVLANVGFNALFIFGLRLGVEGAALGTIVARVLELIVIVLLCHVKKFRFTQELFKPFKIEKSLFKAISKKSIIFLANELFWVVGTILLSLAYAQRNGVLSALSVVNSMGNIFNIIFQGLSIGIGVLVGGYLGQSDFENAKRYTKNVYYLGFLLSAIFGVLIIVFSSIIPKMFKEIDPNQIGVAKDLLIIYGALLWGNCLYCCCYMTLKTGGQAFVTFCLDSGLMWLVSVPLVWSLVSFTSLSILVIYAIIMSFDLVKFAIGISYVRKGTWLKNLAKDGKEKYVCE